MSNRDYSSTYYNRRDSPQNSSGMYDRSPPQPSFGGRRSPPKTRIPKVNNNSLDDLRREFQSLSEDPILKEEDFTFDKMGAKVQDMLEQRANEPVIDSDGVFHFPPPPKRKRDKRDMPLIINGQIVPRKDALLLDLVLNNKSTLEAQLQLTKHPIVGLEYMVEYIDPEGQSPRVYHCTLCKQFNTTASVMEHITGYNHRVRFIANKYPNQAKTYLLPDGRRSNRNFALIRMAQGRAQELELVYGRGEYVVKNERPTIPEEVELDQESDIIHVESGRQTEVLKSAMNQIRACKMEGEEDVRIAKQIINDLTDAIIEYKQSASEQQMNAGINSLVNQSRGGSERY